MAAKQRAHEVRIIGGKWKGRKLRFRGDDSLRPTLGRTRETLFNWLRASLPDMRCLDLFAGSGVLGFEALSQGAGHCTFVEQNRQTLAQLRANAEMLAANPQCQIVGGDARRFLQRQTQPFDLVFLDPPFHNSTLLAQACDTLCDNRLLGGYLYAESDSLPRLLQLADRDQLQVVRQTRSGSAHGVLFETSTDNNTGH
ncbi:MAG: 16S rRNA (guanine(966)-N(2))-methyltransferase RsmD [Pseudomonadota bacterium]